MRSNFDVALADEMKRVVRSTYEVPLIYRRIRLNRSFGERHETIYVHPDVPGICFRSRGEAAAAAITRQST